MKYDHIIVGGGTAGCIVAARLSEDPERSVLLLEAGPDFPDFAQLPDMLKIGWGTVNLEARAAGSPYNWSFTGEATPQQGPMPVPRGKALGGSSAINGQTFIRGAAEDYDTWAEWGNDHWSYLQCLPYFRKLENDADFHDDFHGTDGPVPVRRFPREAWPVLQQAFYQACTDAGYPYNPDVNNPDATGISQRAENNIDGVRMSMALAYIAPIRHRLNLTIKPNVQALRIIFDGARATGLEVESGGERFVVEGEEIILCAGAVVSPQLLMLSGVGPREQLGAFGIPVVADLPGVGQNMRDHPNVQVRFRVREGTPEDPDAMRAVRLRYTASGSDTPNDMILSPASLNTVVREGDDPSHSVNCGLYLAKGKGELRLTSADPHVQPKHGLPLPGGGLGPGTPAGVRPAVHPFVAAPGLQRRHRGDGLAVARRPGIRRSAGRLDDAWGEHVVSHFWDLQDGPGRRRLRRGGPAPEGARRRRAAGRGRLSHARRGACQHQRNDHDDR